MRDENVAGAPRRAMTSWAACCQQADTPATRAAIRDELLTNADTSSAAGHPRLPAAAYREQIARFPGLNDELGHGHPVRASARTRPAAPKAACRRRSASRGRGVVAKYLQYGDENATKAMQRRPVANKDPAQGCRRAAEFRRQRA
jgi:hypothetical protein